MAYCLYLQQRIEDESNTFLQNIGTYVPKYRVSLPSRVWTKYCCKSLESHTSYKSLVRSHLCTFTAFHRGSSSYNMLSMHRVQDMNSYKCNIMHQHICSRSWIMHFTTHNETRVPEKVKRCKSKQYWNCILIALQLKDCLNPLDGIGNKFFLYKEQCSIMVRNEACSISVEWTDMMPQILMCNTETYIIVIYGLLRALFHTLKIQI